VHNSDRTNTLGFHLEYERPIADSGWRVGSLLTANYMSHPKRPNYDLLQNVQRDPGTSQAFNVGVGVGRSHHLGTFGVDVIYEPIWSHTSADTEVPIETSPGVFLPAGSTTSENQFRFSNRLVRGGASRDFRIDPENIIRLQFGVQARSINYTLEQQNFVESVERSQKESWTEWSRNWGMSLRSPGFEIHYRWRSTSGTGRPGLFSDFGLRAGGLDPSGQGVLVAPNGPMVLQGVRVTTHQFSISVPIR
jgi:hypothetical protein